MGSNAFEKLHSKVFSVLKKLGIENPTYVQEIAIEKLLNTNQSAIIVAPTGVGKTEAAILPIISKMLKDNKLSPLTLIYITPLRALNRDIFRRLISILDELNIKVDIRHGDTPRRIRRIQSANPPTVLITTPETINIILWSPNFRKHLCNTKYIIIDEVHNLVNNKRGEQLALALERIKLKAKDPQIILLSATISKPRDVLRFFNSDKDGLVINASQQKKYEFRVVYIAPKVEFSKGTLIIKPNLDKLVASILNDIKESKGKVLIFTNTRDFAELLATYLISKTNAEIIGVHHSSIDRELRVRTEKELRSGKLKAVVATSSLELGIDIGNIELVVQVGSPRRIEVLLQRVGRAGHYVERVSRGKIYALSMDDLLEILAIIRLAKQGVIEDIEFPKLDIDVLAHQLIGIVRDYKFDKDDYPTIEEVYRVITRAAPFKSLSFVGFKNILRFLEKKSKIIRQEGNLVRLTKKSLKIYFDNISMIPTTVKYKVVDISSNKPIGELDEKFVYELKQGKTFILAGRSREVLRIDEEKRQVIVRTTHISSEPPEWVGEIMPVSEIVAQEVGLLRKLLFVGGNLGVEEINVSKWRKILRQNYRNLSDLPDNEKILVEFKTDLWQKGNIVIHSLLGTKANKILSLVLFRLFLEKTSIPVIDVFSDAYRIVIELYPGKFRRDEISTAINNIFRELVGFLERDELESFIKDTVKKSLHNIAWHFLVVAKRLNVIPGDAQYPKKTLFMIMRDYINSIVMDTTVREFLFMRGNIRVIRKFISDYSYGKIPFRLKEGLSFFASPEIFIVNTGDLENIAREYTKKYYSKIANRRVKWLCLSCGYTEIRRVKQGVFDKCPQCGSRHLTVTKPSDLVELLFEKLKRREELTPRERQKFSTLLSLSQLVRMKPKITLLAVAAPGVNINIAVSLALKYNDIDSLLKRLQELEASYSKLKF